MLNLIRNWTLKVLNHFRSNVVTIQIACYYKSYDLVLNLISKFIFLNFGLKFKLILIRGAASANWII